MKNKPLWALLCVLTFLAGCSASEVPPTQSQSPSPLPSASELPPPPPEEEVITYGVTTLTEENTLHAEDGTLLLSTWFHLPSLSAYREDGSTITEAETAAEEAALAAVSTFNERFADWFTSTGVQDISDMAAEDYTWRIQEGIEWTGGYTLELDCSTYQTERMISVSGLYYYYTGGAHPNSVYLAWNFDPENGTFFGPESLGDGQEFQTTVTEELIRQCRERAAEYEMEGYELFWPDYETILADWQSYAVSFDGENMTVSFSPYELAAYAAGPQIFEISYDFLKPYLSLQGMELLGLVEEPGA